MAGTVKASQSTGEIFMVMGYSMDAFYSTIRYEAHKRRGEERKAPLIQERAQAKTKAGVGNLPI